MKRVYADSSPIFARMERADFDRPDWQRICIEAHSKSLNDQIDELQAIEKLERGRIQVLPHQIDAVMTAINKMGTRAILADEVGLGKTIEAGIIIKEYLSRRLVSRVLILCPAPLTTQWRGELQEKFGEPFNIADGEDDPDYRGWEHHSHLIASIDTAKKASHAERILALPWDMVVIDEAHRLKNDQTVGYRFIKHLKSRFMLMLTATPIQNSLFELYNLVNLLQEGLLGTPDFFRDRFVADKQGRVLANPDALSERLRRVMIRHRRAEVGLHFVDRHVESLLLTGTPAEIRLHDEVIDFVRNSYQGNEVLTFIRLSRMLASSPHALRSSIEHSLEHGSDPVVQQGLTRLAALAEETAASGENTKLQALRTILAPLGQEKAIVFTGFYETQKHLAVRLSAMGYKVVLFSGRMSQKDKDRAVEEFRKEGQILLATDAGSEGVNLQFAHVLVNYDLPWNPMRVEQRIGRVHRLGQTKDVLIFNLAIRDTIEEYVLRILETKIQLFSHAVGETDLILSSLRGPESIEKAIVEIIAQSGKENLADGFRLLGDQLEMARKAAEHIREFDEKTLSLLDLSAIEGVTQ